MSTSLEKPLGRLDRVDLREVWVNEAGDFTPWLAREENIQLLGEAIGLELEVEAKEKDVGPFRADILCKDTATDAWVLVENQLEKTDHTHLGQLLTYAAGLQAVAIVWVAERFTEEHRATLDWLNEITDDRFNFFGLEIELWKIGDSPVAPKFNVVCKPNDWSKSVSEAAKDWAAEDLTETRRLQLDFWTAFREYMTAVGSFVKVTRPWPQPWLSMSIGRPGFVLNSILNTRDNRLAVHLVMTGENAKNYFHLLQADKSAIEAEIGTPLNWNELPTKKQSRIELNRTGIDSADKGAWPGFHQWLKEKLELFQKAFAPRVKELTVDEEEAEDEVPA
jgi:hypothetical protein